MIVLSLSTFSQTDNDSPTAYWNTHIKKLTEFFSKIYLTIKVSYKIHRIQSSILQFKISFFVIVHLFCICFSWYVCYYFIKY